MKKYLRITMSLLTCSVLIVAFQNCGGNFQSSLDNSEGVFDLSAELSELDFEEFAGKSSDEGFNEPGWVSKISIDENPEVGKYLIIYFQKGLKEKGQQDLGSSQRHYYNKWNFFVDGEYLTTFENIGHCGDTKQSNCAIGASIEGLAKLKNRRGETVSIQITTLHEGLQSSKTVAIDVLIPEKEEDPNAISRPDVFQEGPDLISGSLYRYDGLNVFYDGEMICRINSNSKSIEGLIDLDTGGTTNQKRAIAEQFADMYKIPVVEERKCN